MAGGCRRRTRSCRSIRTRRCRWRRWCGNRARRRGCAGRRGSRTASCGASTDAGLSSTAREHNVARSRGVLAGAATCTVGKRMCGLRAMGARRTRCCFSTARARPSRRRALSSGRRGPSAAASGPTAAAHGGRGECGRCRRRFIGCGLGRPCARDSEGDAACGAAALRRRGDEGGCGLAVGRANYEVESLQPMRSSRWSRCCSAAMPKASRPPELRGIG